MTSRASLEVFEIETKKVVPFDHVGIALLDDAHHLFEHRALVHLGALEQALEAGRIGQRNRDNAIAFARRRRKFKTGRDVGLDIELEAAQFGEIHPDEKRRAGKHQMLLDRIGEDQVWRVGRVRRLAGQVPEMALDGFQSVQRVEGDEHLVAEIAVEHARLVRRPESFEQRNILDQRKQPNRTALARELARRALIHVDLGLRRRLDGDHARIGGIAEQQSVAVELCRNFLVGGHRELRTSIVHPRSRIRQRVRANRFIMPTFGLSRVALRRPSEIVRCRDGISAYLTGIVTRLDPAVLKLPPGWSDDRRHHLFELRCLQTIASSSEVARVCRVGREVDHLRKAHRREFVGQLFGGKSTQP